MPEVVDCLIYYTTSIITKKILQLSKCEFCKNALSNPEYHAKSASLFFEMTDDSQLPHPNTKLYSFLQQVEQSFQTHHTSSNVFELVITDILQKKLITFACINHAEEILSFIICSYVQTRMRQYAKLSNRNQTKKSGLKRKQSKFYYT